MDEVLKVIGPRATHQKVMLFCPKCQAPHLISVYKSDTVSIQSSYDRDNSRPWAWNGSVTDPMVQPCCHVPTSDPKRECQFYVYCATAVALYTKQLRDQIEGWQRNGAMNNPNLHVVIQAWQGRLKAFEDVAVKSVPALYFYNSNEVIPMIPYKDWPKRFQWKQDE